MKTIVELKKMLILLLINLNKELEILHQYNKLLNINHTLKSVILLLFQIFMKQIYLDSYYDFEVWTLDSLVDQNEDYFNFRKFYYLLSKDNLISIDSISNTKVCFQLLEHKKKEITKKFYQEYSILRKNLFKDIIK